MKLAGADFLSGTIRIERGSYRDYRELAHFHYAPGNPAVVCAVWRVCYRPSSAGRRHNCKLKIAHGQFAIDAFRSRAPASDAARIIAVAVLSYPRPYSLARERELGLLRGRHRAKTLWLNANMRTISRVIVHPQFRSLGIASALVRRVLVDCPVRYVEAFAVMGRIVPFFQRAGMRAIDEGYFLFDRGCG